MQSRFSPAVEGEGGARKKCNAFNSQQEEQSMCVIVGEGRQCGVSSVYTHLLHFEASGSKYKYTSHGLRFTLGGIGYRELNEGLSSASNRWLCRVLIGWPL